MGDEAAPAPTRRFAWVRAATDRVPTTWLAGAATAVFLGATAAFGGLATAAEPAPSTIEPGIEHRNDQLAITVERAVLLDDFPEAGARADDGERVLVLLVRLENTWDRPVRLFTTSTAVASIGVADLDELEPHSTARYDDATSTPTLQPGVPADIVLTWLVDDDRFADGDELHLTLYDMQLYTASFVASGQWWQNPEPAVTLAVPLDDVGAGMDADTDGTDS